MIESIVGGLILALFAGLLGYIIGGKQKVTTEEFERHREASIPHPNLPCMVHTEKLNSIERQLSCINEKLDSLLSRWLR